MSEGDRGRARALAARTEGGSNTAPTEHQKMRPILPLPKADVQSRLHSCLQLALKIVNIAGRLSNIVIAIMFKEERSTRRTT